MLLAEADSVDSARMTNSHTTTGHQLRISIFGVGFNTLQAYGTAPQAAEKLEKRTRRGLNAAREDET